MIDRSCEYCMEEKIIVNCDLCGVEYCNKCSSKLGEYHEWDYGPTVFLCHLCWSDLKDGKVTGQS